MKKVFEHLKPHRVLLLFAIVMLFVQSFSDLRLPDYMSQIVNVGIQQSGVEHGSPDEISKDGMQFLLALMPEKNASEFTEAYELDGDVYVLKNHEKRDKLDLYVGEAAWTLMSLSENMDGAPQDMEESFELKQLYALTPYLEMVDLSEAHKTAEAVSNNLKEQTAVVFAQMFYKELDYDLSSMQQKYILKTGAQMLGITLLGMLATIAVSYFASKVGAGFSKSLRREVFAKIESFSNAEFEKFSSSSLVVRTTNDVNQVQQIVLMGLRMFLYAPIMAIGGIIMIQKHETSMMWIVVSSIVSLSVLLLIVFILAVPKFKLMQKFVDRLNQVFRENLNGVMVIRAFSNHDFEKKRFDKANKDRADLSLFINSIMTFMMPVMMFLMNVTMIAILWFGAHEISEGALQIGNMMAFMQYTMQIIFSFLMISMLFIFVPRAIVSMNRINEVLNMENQILDIENPESLELNSQDLRIQFENVSFQYGDAELPILCDINFESHAGQVTAIVGSTGSGKSTLINLLPRFFDVSEGRILINGQDIRDVSQKDLRDQIAYVPQKSVLLSGTVASNLRYGNDDASDEEMLHALDVAQAQFVLEHDDPLEMDVSQLGSNLSGGQKQRLSIARAVVKKAPIYIFDDSFSALDFKTDSILRARLKEELPHATMFIVAQRVNTIMDADQILVLDEGKLVAKGTHSELLKNSKVYYEIASSQLTKEELDHEKS